MVGNKDYALKVVLKRLSNLYNRDNFNIVCILDKFSYECFKYEGSFFQLGTSNWESLFLEKKPKFLFVESTWQGYNYQWINKVANIHISKDKTLLSIVNYCKTNQIPTIFWAKEDPYDFHVFIEAAKLFDYVFTTDSNCIPKYKEILGHNDVFLLPFAAQPRIHNPVDKDKEKIGTVAFAGAWYDKFPKRSIHMENLLKPAFKHNLTIYDRFSGLDDNNFKFPEEYTPYIKSSLKYENMVQEYKKYEIFLNVNSIDTSPTTFARRIFELLCCGIPIISSYSLGVENYFKDIVMLSKNEEDTKNHLDKLVDNKELKDKLSLLGQREVLSNHTYKHRFNLILDSIGFNKNQKPMEGGSIINYASSHFSLKNILDNYLCQEYALKELIIVINSNSINVEKWNEKLKDHNCIKLFKLSINHTLGDCLNFAVEKSKYNYISIFHENHYYGPNYLIDSINTFQFSDANIVGKSTFYEYLESSNSLILNYPNSENKYMDYVSFTSLTFKKDLFDKVKFKNISKDYNFLFMADNLRADFKIYSSDRFNYAIIRRKNIINFPSNKKEYIVVEKTKDFKSKITV